MNLIDVAKIIYTKGTASELRHITIQTYNDKRVLWHGEAKDIVNWEGLTAGWIVVEILVDAGCREKDVPDYNIGKIITVM